MAEFQFEIRDDGREVRVAAALAVAVEAALHVRCAFLDRGQGVGYGDFGIVVGVDADDAVEASSARRRRSGRGSSVSVPPLVSQRQSTSAPACLRGFESAQGEVAVVDVAVEEMLGVVDDFFAVVLQVADGFGDDGEVFVFGDAESAGDVEVPALAEDGDDGRSGVDQFTDVAVFLDGVLREARGSEGGELCVFAVSGRAPVRRILCLWDWSRAIRLQCSRYRAHPVFGQ